MYGKMCTRSSNIYKEGKASGDEEVFGGWLIVIITGERGSLRIPESGSRGTRRPGYSYITKLWTQKARTSQSFKTFQSPKIHPFPFSLSFTPSLRQSSALRIPDEIAVKNCMVLLKKNPSSLTIRWPGVQLRRLTPTNSLLDDTIKPSKRKARKNGRRIFRDVKLSNIFHALAEMSRRMRARQEERETIPPENHYEKGLYKTLRSKSETFRSP